jgi:hypothetical protein
MVCAKIVVCGAAFCNNLHPVTPDNTVFVDRDQQIHGIWFYEVPDLEKLGNILNKILAQLPKPDVAPPSEAPPVAASPAPAAGGGSHAAAPPVAAAAAAATARPQGGDDAFWDRSVHVTEETLAGSQQQLVPNSSLVANEVRLRAIWCAFCVLSVGHKSLVKVP